MTEVRRLSAVGAFLALAAVLTCTHVWGGPGKDDELKRFRKSGNRPALNKPDAAPLDIEEELAATKFSDRPVGAYEAADGKVHFWWQLQPALKDSAPRPRDVLILIDTSASQTKGPLKTARKIAEVVAKHVGADDRVALWTANVKPKDVGKGFHAKGKLAEALKALEMEYPSGGTDLGKSLTKAAEGFEGVPDRQRVILFLGDGMSVAGPLDDTERAKVCDELTRREILFVAIPMGARLDPINLHGLACGTGGTVFRLEATEEDASFYKRLDAALSVPVLYPQSAKFSANVEEAYPVKLPPMRADAPTLVVGRVKKGGKLACTLVGSAGGREVKLDLSAKLPVPEADNFFLAGLVRQWREAKDQPAILQADRALAFSDEQVRLAREELLAQAEWALGENQLDAAWNLYEQAKQIDPRCVDAKAGQHVIKQLRDGKLTREQLLKMVKPNPGDLVVRIDEKVRRGRVSREKLKQLAQREEAAQPPEGQPPERPPLIEDERRRQAIEDQAMGELVQDAIQQGRRLLRTNPDAAAELLKRTLDGVLDNRAISRRARQRFADNLRASLRNIAIRGAEIKRDLAQEARRLAEAQAQLGAIAERAAAQDRVRERMRAINELMNRARYEVIAAGDTLNRLAAIRAAESLRNDLIQEGLPIPPALTASYAIAQADFHLSELNELRRLREQRWLLTLLEVERRHIPFPDEPPIEFPPAVRWKALTKQRKNKYETFRFGAGVSDLNLNRLLRELNLPRDFESIQDPRFTLEGMLSALSEKYSAPNANPPFYLTFEVNQKAFVQDGLPDVLATPIAEKKLPELRNTSLFGYLRRILERIQVPSGATFVIRKEGDLPLIITDFDARDLPPPPQFIIEITTGTFASVHKETVGFPVADLVVPIPNSINIQSLGGAATLFGQFGFAGAGGVAGLGGIGGLGGLGGIGGLGLAGIGGIGGIGGLGGLGGLGGIGGLGGVGLAGLGGIGGIGGIGGLAGAVGQVGINGQLLGAGGALGVGGQQNFGVGGGFVGFGGGQLGQFGNLGGQFGLQGGTQEGILMLTIRQLVGTPRDWAPFDPRLAGGQFVGGPGQGGAIGGPGGFDDPQANPEANQLGYFPAALALVVKGTSRIHTRTTRTVGPAGGLGFGALPNDGGRNGIVVIGGPKRGGGRVGGAGDGPGDKPKEAIVKKPGEKKAPAVKVVDDDPRLAWQQAMDKGEISDPGVVVATADFLLRLGMSQKGADNATARDTFGHAAEFLKASLRRGVIDSPWVFESLAIALEESNATMEEIERARIAVVDLDPRDAAALLETSRALADMRRWDRALAFSRQAARLQPNAPQPYADALNYAEKAKDVEAMEWAAGALLERDWPADSEKLHDKAMAKLNELSQTLDAKDAQRLKSAARAKRQRDLVIRASWQGTADVDIKVQEPTGSVCSTLNRQTVGGGTLVGDRLPDDQAAAVAETYVAAEAFAGEYRITAEKVWGDPLGGKVQVQVIQHQGTPRESRRLLTLNLAGDNSTTVKLEGGRRTAAAAVPPPSLRQDPDPLPEGTQTANIMRQLRDLADPDIVGSSKNFSGGVGSLGTSSGPIFLDPPGEKEVRGGWRKFENRVSPFVNNNVSFTARAAVSPDRRYVRLSVNPLFNAVTKTRLRPVNVSVIPGGGRRP